MDAPFPAVAESPNPRTLAARLLFAQELVGKLLWEVE
jgi:hypothetical protein